MFRVEIERAHMEEDAGKLTHIGGATGRIHGADYSLVDYNRAGIPLVEIVTKPIEGAGSAPPRSPRRTSPTCARSSRRSGSPRPGWSAATCAATSTSRCARTAANASAPAPRPRTSTRCAPSSAPSATRSSGTPPCWTPASTIIQETRHWHEDTGTTTSGRVSPTPRTTGTSRSRTWCRSPPTARVGRGAPRRRCPSCRPRAASRLQAEWGYSDAEMQRRRQRRALWTRSRPPSTPAPPPAAARKWWMGELARSANEPDVEPGELPITPAQVAGADQAGRRRRSSTTSWPARSSRACSPARAPRTEVVEKRGLKVVSDDGALAAAIDEALAAQPGHRGQDPRRQGRGGRRARRRGHEGHPRPGRRRPRRELILERLGVEG